MKYADGPTVEVSIHVDATPEQLWPLITDINLPARFSEEFKGAEWIDERRFRGRNAHPAAGEWQTECTVVERIEHGVFTWAVGDPDNPSAVWKLLLSPAAGGGTNVIQWMRMGPAPSGLTPAIEAMPDKEERIVARRLEEHRANMERTVQGIKDLAENG